MLMVPVYNLEKKKMGEVKLVETIFNAPIKKYLLYDIVKMQLNNKRSGNASTKSKALVRGGGIKPFQQKGTGRARQGSIRSPLHPGGGTVFGPMKRDYRYRLPKGVKKRALQIALSYCLKEKKFWVIDQFEFAELKTKFLFKALKKFDLTKGLLIDEANPALERVGRNLASFKLLKTEGINVFDILKFENVLISQKALTKMQQNLKG